MSEPQSRSSRTLSAELPTVLAGTWPDRLRNAFARHLEPFFVILIGLLVMAVFYLFPHNRTAFLNFFYLPVLAAAYFLGKRKATLGATLSILVMVLIAYYYPDSFTVEGNRISALLLISFWGGFLILSSAAVGSLQERLVRGFEETRQLLEELKRSRVAEEMKEKVEKALYATMDPVVAKLATEGKLRFEKREISIMFTDLTNFTTYSDRNRPDVVLDELNAFLGQIEPIIEVFRGHIDKYMGDGVMVEFGAPVDYDRHALLAVLAGWKMQEKVKKLSLPWRLRIGIATGSTIIGMLGVRRQAYSALGDRVNVAKRLEEICQPDKVYIDEPTYRAVEPFVTVTKLRNTGLGRQGDAELVERLNELEEQLARQGETPQLLYEVGKANFQLHDATAAIRHFERALALQPDATDIKVAYADALMKRDEYEKIQLKGKLSRVTVYEISGLRDRWGDPAVIPPRLAKRYLPVEKELEVPEELVLAVEALDGAIGHGRCVALLSYALADHLGLSEDSRKLILQAGYVQDLGKEAVPHHILNRAGSLTEQESKLLEKYVQESVASLKRLGYVDSRLHEIVLHHHEMWSGKGYPDRLAGEEIPLGARITGLAEAYSALTAWRPYRDAWDQRVALSELRKGAEQGRYDPRVADALIEMFKSYA
ncbi:MAG: HD domain-containing protein [Acidobacteriia bacterium]|nr:HD domain-containing protein [Terriglobia bacterium]